MLNPIRRKAIKAEFEASPLSIQELCDKYNIEQYELGDISKWNKTSATTTQPAIIPVVEPVKVAPSIPLDNIDKDEDDLMVDILIAKRNALNAVKGFFEDLDLENVPVKDVKDMMSILKDIEAGELVKKKGNDAPTVNLIIQNLVQRFKDDC
jgi:hypothetical protein